MSLDCQSAQDRLLDFLYGELSEQDRQAYEAHLASCSKCAAEVQAFQQVRKVSADLPIPGLSTQSLECLQKEAAQASHIDKRPWLLRAWDKIPVLSTYPVLSAAAVAMLAIGLSVYMKENKSIYPNVVLPSAETEARRMGPADASSEQAKYAADEAATIHMEDSVSANEKAEYAKPLRERQSAAKLSNKLRATQPEGNANDSIQQAQDMIALEYAARDYAEPPAATQSSPTLKAGGGSSGVGRAKRSASPSVDSSIAGLERNEAETKQKSSLSESELWKRARANVHEKRCSPALEDFTTLLSISESNVSKIKRTIGACRESLIHSHSQFPDLARKILDEKEFAYEE